MGQKDLSEKILEDYQDVFADILNVLLFQGRQVVKPEELCDTKLRSHYRADNGTLHEQERDIAKLWKKGGIIFTFCGLENQTSIDPDIPLRVIGYDGAAYRQQLLKQNKGQRYPVMTLVLYYGTKPWNSPKALKERLQVPEELNHYISDYQTHIFEIAYLTDEQVSMFQSDFQIVADYFVQMRKGQTYRQNTKIIQHVDAMLKFLSIFAKDQEYLNIDLSKHKGGQITMCVVLQEAINQGKIEGEKIGRIAGRSAGIIEGKKIGRSAGIIEGEKIGISKGEDRFARLVQLLISSGRLDDIKKATEDSSYRHELYQAFKIL